MKDILDKPMFQWSINEMAKVKELILNDSDKRDLLIKELIKNLEFNVSIEPPRHYGPASMRVIKVEDLRAEIGK